MACFFGECVRACVYGFGAFWMEVRMRIGEGSWNTFAALQSVMHGFEVRNPVVLNSQCLGGSTIN